MTEKEKKAKDGPMVFQKLDPLLHSELRLAVMSYLVAQSSSDFNELREITQSTAGNLSVQLKKLEEAGYLKITKGFKDNYQHTAVELTDAGLKAFEEYVNALKTYFNG
jgi:DNA-binding MarR family transcriptional regulator